MGTPGPGSAGVPAFEAVIGVVAGAVGFGRATRPPDEPERAQYGDLEDHEEKEDGQEAVHALSLEPSAAAQPLSLARLLAQPRSASVWASSRPVADSVGTSSVGAARFWAHS